jgi:hypothetical protein
LCPRIFALFTLRTLLNAVIRCSQFNTQGVLGRLPASGLLVIDADGLRSMYFVVMPKVNLIVILMTYVCYLYSINCPTVICLPSMLYLSYGETPLVNYRPRSNFLYIALPFYFYLHCLLSCILLSFYHLIRSIVCLQQTGEIDNLLKTHQQYFWRHCLGCHKASKHHLLKFGFLLLVR